MVDHDDLKDRLQLLRVRLENASCVSPRERDLWTSLIAEIIAISESKESSDKARLPQGSCMWCGRWRIGSPALFRARLPTSRATTRTTKQLENASRPTFQSRSPKTAKFPKILLSREKPKKKPTINASLGIFILLILFLPIHIWDATTIKPAIGSKKLAYIRIPLQFLLMYGAYLIYLYSLPITQ